MMTTGTSFVAGLARSFEQTANPSNCPGRCRSSSTMSGGDEIATSSALAPLLTATTLWPRADTNASIMLRIESWSSTTRMCIPTMLVRRGPWKLQAWHLRLTLRTQPCPAAVLRRAELDGDARARGGRSPFASARQLELGGHVVGGGLGAKERNRGGTTEGRGVEL